MMETLLLAIVACMLSYLGVEQLRRLAMQRNIFDVPNERSSHSQPTPRGGGLAIVVVTLMGLAVFSIALPDLRMRQFPWGIAAYAAGAVMIAWVSWQDDIRSMPQAVRFMAHMLGAVLILLVIGSWQAARVPMLPTLALGVLGIPITFVWIVGLTNAYNFMDGIDGIAGSQAVIAGSGWFILSVLSTQPLVGLLAALLAASSLGFLAHNWSPARIFMGDVGSSFLGYSFAVLPVLAANKDPRLVLAGGLLVWPFLFDAVSTFLRRLLAGENVLEAHRSHLYQRLTIVGYSHRVVALVYIALELVGLVLAVAWVLAIPNSGLAILLTVPLLWVALYMFVLRQERRTEAAPRLTNVAHSDT